MNRTTNRIPAELSPETRFELRPYAATTFRVIQESEFERLKSRLLAGQLAAAAPELNAPLRRAANEAAALAWVTFYPLLVFPGTVRGKDRRRTAPDPAAGAHLRGQPRTARRMKTQRELEAGAMRVRACALKHCIGGEPFARVYFFASAQTASRRALFVSGIWAFFCGHAERPPPRFNSLESLSIEA